ncbi:MAG: hypothetical protein ACM3JB_20570 [Acidobacteriaceae bacterium]
MNILLVAIEAFAGPNLLQASLLYVLATKEEQQRLSERHGSAGLRDRFKYRIFARAIPECGNWICHGGPQAAMQLTE